MVGSAVTMSSRPCSGPNVRGAYGPAGNTSASAIAEPAMNLKPGQIGSRWIHVDTAAEES